MSFQRVFLQKWRGKVGIWAQFTDTTFCPDNHSITCIHLYMLQTIKWYHFKLHEVARIFLWETFMFIENRKTGALLHCVIFSFTLFSQCENVENPSKNLENIKCFQWAEFVIRTKKSLILRIKDWRKKN